MNQKQNRTKRAMVLLLAAAIILTSVFSMPLSYAANEKSEDLSDLDTMLDDGINPDYIRLFLGQEDILTTWGHYLYDRRTIDENRKMLNSALSEDVPDQE